MSGFITAGIVSGLLLTVLLYGFTLYNRLLSEVRNVEEKWARIDAVLREQIAFLPGLIQRIAPCFSREKDLLGCAQGAEASYLAAGTPEETVYRAEELSRVVGRMFAAAENCPELKKDGTFPALRQQYFETEDELTQLRRNYNRAARAYNRFAGSVPAHLIADLCHMAPRPLFRAEREETAVELRF